MTIDELIEKYADEAYQFAHEAYVIETKYLEAYEQAKKPDTALVQKLVDAMKSNTAQCSKMHHKKADQNHEDFGRCPPVERYCQALTEAQAWLEQQEVVCDEDKEREEKHANIVKNRWVNPSQQEIKE